MTSATLTIELEWAGSGVSVGSMLVPACELDAKAFTWMDMQAKVHVFLRSCGKLNETSDYLLRLFAWHGGPELTAICIQDAKQHPFDCKASNAFKAWVSWVSSMKCDSSDFKLLVVGTYHHDELVKADLGHPWGCGMKLQNKQLVLEAVASDGLRLIDASATLRDDLEVVCTALKSNGHAYALASERLQASHNVALLALQQTVNDRPIQTISPVLTTCREFAMIAVQVCGLYLGLFSEVLRRDQDLVLQAVCQDGMALEFAKGFLNDVEVVLAACRNNKKALSLIDNPHKLVIEHPEIRAMMFEYGYALKFASEGQRNDQQYVMDQVCKNGQALAHAPQAFRNNKSLVLAAVTQDGMALVFAGEVARSDKEVVLCAYTQNPDSFPFISHKLLRDNMFVHELLRQHPSGFKQWTEYRCDATPELALYVVQCHGYEGLKNVPWAFQSKKVVFAALKKSPEALSLLPWHLAKVDSMETELPSFFVACCEEANFSAKQVASEACRCYCREMCLQILYVFYYNQLAVSKKLQPP